MFKKAIDSFFKWYEKHYLLNVSIAAGLFVIQLIHLYWLSADVVAFKLIGQSFFHLTGFWELVITLVDYTEIPALITTSLIYINDLRKGAKLKPLLYLIFLNSQWLHIFWITDEFVIEHLTRHTQDTVLPVWLALVAIAIDYLELPVIFDTLKKLKKAIQDRNIKEVAEALKED